MISSPFGDLISFTSPINGAVSSLSGTIDLDFLGLFAGTEDQLSAIKQPVNDVGLILNAVVNHLAFTIGTENQQCRCLPMLDFWGHLDVCFRSVVENTKRANMLISPNDVAEVHLLHGDHCRRDFRIPTAQSLSTFTALQRRGIESRLVVFPEENHWVLRPANSLQWHNEVFGWLDKYLKPAP